MENLSNKIKVKKKKSPKLSPLSNKYKQYISGGKKTRSSKRSPKRTDIKVIKVNDKQETKNKVKKEVKKEVKKQEVKKQEVKKSPDVVIKKKKKNQSKMLM